MTVLQPPGNDELEVSVFGPGYGETVVVHLGLGDWLLVDSCLDKRTNIPASISYLRKLGINPATAVRIIVASHWHDDHVGGLASLLEECPGATFWCSGSLQTKEFLTLVRALGTRSIDRGVQEFAKITNLLRERASTGKPQSQGPQWASENTRIWQRSSGAVLGEIFSLSPSSAAMTLSFHEISQLLPRNDQQKKQLVAMRPNQAAVVLWVSVGGKSLILVSDLEEESSDQKRGWSVIVDSSTKPAGTAQMLKIPHHGSENGHHSRVWSEMLVTEPFAVLTPFVNGGVTLPKRADARRICQLTANAYSSTSVLAPQQKKRHGALDRTIKQVARTIRTIPNIPGHVRIRNKLSSSDWSVELFDGAVKLSEAIRA
jgi:hypothetical protein